MNSPAPLPPGFDPDCAASYRSLGGGRYRPSRHVQGAWRADEQHMAPVAGLLSHAIDQQAPRPDLRLARVSFDILGMIPAGDGTVTVEVLRPGRTIELVAATLEIGGRAVVTARAWRLQAGDTTTVAAVHDPVMPPPDQTAVWSAMDRWPGGFIESLELRAPADVGPGRGRCWLRSPVELVEGEPVSELNRLLGLVDTANGCFPAADPDRWMFPNTDLTIHLHRIPSGTWLGLDVTASVGVDGVGVTSAVLHDLAGPFGRSEQAVTVRPLPSAQTGSPSQAA